MATQLDEIVLKLSAQNDQLLSALKTSQKQTSDSMKNMEKVVGEFSKNSNKSLTVFQTSMATMAGVVGGEIVTGAFNLFKQAAGFAFDQLKDGVKDAAEAEISMNRLKFAFASSGLNAKKSSAEFKDFAEEIQRTTAFEDDAIIKTGALMQSMARLSVDGLKKATTAAVDMSAALGIDLETATRAVGKAMQGELSGLARAGILIKETGDKSIDAAKALQVLNERFGGAAKNQIVTFSGALAQAKNGYGNLVESAGALITDNPVIVKLLNATSAKFAELATYLEQNKQVLMSYVGEGLQLLITALQDGVLPVLSATYEALELSSTWFIQFGKTVGAVAAAIVQAVQGNFSEAGAIIKEQLTDSFEKVKATFNSGDNIFDKMSKGMGTFKVAAQEGMTALSSGATLAKEPVARLTEQVTEFAIAMKSNEEVINGVAQALVDQSTNMQAQMDYQLEILAANREMGLISDQEYYAQKEALYLNHQLTEQMILNNALKNKKMSEDTYRAASAQSLMNYDLQQRKIQEEKAKFDADKEKQRQANFSQTMSFITSLSSSSNKKLAAIGKAAAITSAVMDTYKAANVALASAPPPFNYGLAAAVVAAGLANVAKIKSTKAAKGIDNVPGIGGSDNFPAILAPGERVVPRETNKDLREFLDNVNVNAVGNQSIRIELSLKDELIEMIEAKLIERSRNGISLGLV